MGCAELTQASMSVLREGSDVSDHLTVRETVMRQQESDTKPDRARLSEAKRRLLQKYLRGKPEKEKGERALICPRPPGEPVPLSFAQQQIWLHGQIAAGVPFYNESIAVHRPRPLDVAVLERGLLESSRRHEVWRTTLEAEAGA